MFKNESGKKQTAIEQTNLKIQLEADAVNYTTIRKFLIIYLATVAIPEF